MPADATESRSAPAWIAVGTFALLPYAELLAANGTDAVDTRLVTILAASTLALCLAPVALAARFGPGAMRRVSVWVALVVWSVTHFASFPRSGAKNGLLIWAALVVLAAVPLIPLSRRGAVQVFVSVFGGALLAVTTIGGAATYLTPRGVAATPMLANEPFIDTATSRPNVYFIVLDGYGSARVLDDHFDVDIGGFVDFLHDEGFVHQADAVANYPTTFLSLSSTLDSAYLVEAGGHMGPSFEPYFERVRGLNRTVSTFKALGYRYVHASPGIWEGSTCGGFEDVCLGNTGGMGETGWALLQRTPFARASSDLLGQRDHVADYGDPSHVVPLVLEAREPSTPTFAFIHLVAPHPPYTRTADCEVRHDTDLQLETFGEDRSLYADAVRCLNRQLQEAVATLVRADPEALIILQSDHGPGFGFDWNDPDAPLDERMPIFSAWRVPAECERTLMSAINTFRYVLSCLANDPIPAIEDLMLWGGFRGRDAQRVEREEIGLVPVPSN